MKKTVFLATAAILTGMVASSAVFADDNTTTTMDPKLDTVYNTKDAAGNPTATSNAWVTFTTPSKNPDKPVIPNPSEPDHPKNPGEGGNTNPGLLDILWAPRLDFGSHELSASTQTWNGMDPKAKDAPAFAQVTDQRGTATGWSLHVKEDDQFKMADNTELKGATLKFNDIHFIDPKMKETTALSGAATGKDLLKNDTTVMEAPAGTLNGIYSANFGTKPADGGVTLTVPGNAALVGKYTTTLTWTLNAAPDAAPATTPAK